jgi:hypothetical protein
LGFRVREHFHIALVGHFKDVNIQCHYHKLMFRKCALLTHAYTAIPHTINRNQEKIANRLGACSCLKKGENVHVFHFPFLT